MMDFEMEQSDVEPLLPSIEHKVTDTDIMVPGGHGVTDTGLLLPVGHEVTDIDIKVLVDHEITDADIKVPVCHEVADTDVKVPVCHEVTDTEVDVPVGQTDSSGYSGDYLDGNIVDLPTGMKYHLFVSHSSQDVEKVNLICDKLENVFRLKCCISDRDFTSGMSIDENIKNEMSRSVKVLVVLTPDFFDSNWCEGELISALEQSPRKENRLIPILLSPLENSLPTNLKPYRYIDVCDDDIATSSIAAKVYEAYCHPGVLEHDVSQQNGFLLMKNSPSKSVPFCSRGWIYQFSYLTSRDLEKFEKSETKVKELMVQYNIIVEYINNLFLTKYRRIFTKRVLGIVIFLSGLIGFCMTFGLPCLAIIIEKSALHVPNNMLLWSLLAGCLSGISVFCVMVISYKILVKRAVNGMWMLNRKYYIRSKCVILWYSGIFGFDYNYLYILRYDITQCKVKLAGLLKRLLISNSKEELDAQALRLVDEKLFSLMKSGSLIQWEVMMESSGYNRHNTYLSKKCLCQLIEPSLNDQKKNVNV